MSWGTRIGVGVGAAVGRCVIVALIVMWVLRKRRSRKADGEHTMSENTEAEVQKTVEVEDRPRHELAALDPKAQGAQSIAELPGESVQR